MQLESRIGRVIIIWVLPQGCGGDFQYLPQEDSRKIPLSRLYFLRQNTFLTQCFAVFMLRSSLYSLGWLKAHTDVPPSVTHCEFDLLVCWVSVKGRRKKEIFRRCAFKYQFNDLCLFHLSVTGPTLSWQMPQISLCGTVYEIACWPQKRQTNYMGERPMCGVNTVGLQYLPKHTVIIEIISQSVGDCGTDKMTALSASNHIWSVNESYFILLPILAPIPDYALSRADTFVFSSVLKANPVVVWIMRSWKPERL